MENKEIIEGNKLIAFFMDLTDNNYGQQFIVENNKDWVSASNLKFHTSWDWLMPVVEKIEKIEMDEGTLAVNIECQECEVKHYGSESVSYEEGEMKIEATFKAVVEFIKWYNETQPNEQ